MFGQKQTDQHHATPFANLLFIVFMCMHPPDGGGAKGMHGLVSCEYNPPTYIEMFTLLITRISETGS